MEETKQPLIVHRIEKKDKTKKDFRRLVKKLKLDSLKHKENNTELNRKISEMEKKLNEIKPVKLISDVKFFFICRLFLTDEPARICVEYKCLLNYFRSTF